MEAARNLPQGFLRTTCGRGTGRLTLPSPQQGARGKAQCCGLRLISPRPSPKRKEGGRSGKGGRMTSGYKAFPGRAGTAYATMALRAPGAEGCRCPPPASRGPTQGPASHSAHPCSGTHRGSEQATEALRASVSSVLTGNMTYFVNVTRTCVPGTAPALLPVTFRPHSSPDEAGTIGRF